LLFILLMNKLNFFYLFFCSFFFVALSQPSETYVWFFRIKIQKNFIIALPSPMIVFCFYKIKNTIWTKFLMVPSMMVENSFELTRILSYLRTKAEFSNHHFCVCKSKDSSELKFRKIFNSNEFSPMRGDGNTRKIFLNFNSEEL
jgi:hypothetical protein